MKKHGEKLLAAKAWLAANPPKTKVVIGLYARDTKRIPARHPGGPLKKWEVNRD